MPIRISNDDIDFHDTDKHLKVCRLSKSGTISSKQHKRTKFTKIKMTVCKSDTTHRNTYKKKVQIIIKVPHKVSTYISPNTQFVSELSKNKTIFSWLKKNWKK